MLPVQSKVNGIGSALTGAKSFVVERSAGGVWHPIAHGKVNSRERPVAVEHELAYGIEELG